MVSEKTDLEKFYYLNVPSIAGNASIIIFVYYTYRRTIILFSSSKVQKYFAVYGAGISIALNALAMIFKFTLPLDIYHFSSALGGLSTIILDMFYMHAFHVFFRQTRILGSENTEAYVVAR
jgi:cystathionine beta-lyase/cystathionine gamma-synthase